MNDPSPYPGGPYNKTPRGGVIPILSKASGWINGHSATYRMLDQGLGKTYNASRTHLSLALNQYQKKCHT